MKWRFVLILLLLIFVTWGIILSWPDKNLHVIFCDVGQGDAALITLGSWQMLVDAGPDARVMQCLQRHMPLWDRTIEIAMMTHPQADHVGGFERVLDSYRIGHMVAEPEGNTSDGFVALGRQLVQKQVHVRALYSGSELRLGRLTQTIIWPEYEFTQARLTGQVMGAWTDVVTGTDLNQLAMVHLVRYGEFSVLFTGDADALAEPMELQTGLLRKVDVLKVPHHGSKTGMTKEWLDVVHPTVAVISVGAKNRYGHPTQEALKMLRDVGSRVMRTDQDGEIEVESDGVKWWIRSHP